MLVRWSWILYILFANITFQCLVVPGYWICSQYREALEIDQLEASIAKLTEDIGELTKAVAELDAAMAKETLPSSSLTIPGITICVSLYDLSQCQ